MSSMVGKEHDETYASLAAMAFGSQISRNYDVVGGIGEELGSNILKGQAQFLLGWSTVVTTIRIQIFEILALSIAVQVDNANS